MYTTTFDGTNVSMYKDTILATSASVDMIDAMNVVSVGNPSNWNASIQASVDEFTIWSDALSTSEIDSLFAVNALPEPSGLLLMMVGLGIFSLFCRRRR